MTDAFRLRCFFALAFIAVVPFFSCSVQNKGLSRSLYEEGYGKLVLGDLDGAAALLKKSLKADRKNAESCDALSFCLIEKKEYKKAALYARKAALNYENAFLHDDRLHFKADSLVQAGEAYLWAGLKKKAFVQFDQALESGGYAYDVMTGITAAAIRSGCSLSAADFFERQIRSFSDSERLAPLYLMYAALMYSGGETEKSFFALQMAQEHCVRAGIQDYDKDIAALFERISVHEEQPAYE